MLIPIWKKMLKFTRRDYWSSFALRVGEKLCFLGNLVDSPIGLIIFTFIGISLNSPLISPEATMNAQHTTLGTLKLTQRPIFIISTTCRVASAEQLLLLDRNIDVNDSETCPCKISGFTVASPSPGNQRSLISTDYEGSVDEPLNTIQYVNNCEIKQSGNLLNTSMPSSSPTELKDESQQLCDKKASFPAKVNGGLMQRSKSRLKSWCSYIKNHWCNSTSCYRLEKLYQLAIISYVFSSKYTFLSLLLLFLLLADGMFGFMKRPYIGVSAAVIIVLGDGISGFMTRNNGPLATCFQYDFATLIYGIARSLMFLSLILKQTQREWLSHLMAGLAWSWLTLGVLCYSINCLPLDYACAEVSVLLFFLLFTICYGFTPERID